jgi:hypothetical protein
VTTAAPRLHALTDFDHDGGGASLLPRVPASPAVPAVPAPTRAATGPSRAELYRLLHMVLEVLDGRRPAAHVERYVAHTCLQALRTRVSSQAGDRQTHRLRNLHLRRPAARSVELCATVQRGERLVAAAGHVEIGRNGWRCTTLRFL